MKARLEHIAQYIEKNCSADDYTLNVQFRDSHETRFAQNAVTQHMAGQNMGIHLEVAFGSKTGSASINQTDEASLDYVIRTAENMAKLNQPDPEFIPSEGSKEIPMIDDAYEATLNLSGEKMVDIVKTCILNAEKKDARVSGMTEKHYGMHLTATKNGFFGIYENADFGHSMTMKKDEVETKVSYSTKDYSAFSLEDQLNKLNAQFASLGAPQSFDPCKIPVIIRPSALMDYLGFLGWMMNRRQADEGLTAFTDQLGKKFFGARFSLASLVNDPLMSSTPFSYDGLVSEDVWWVKDGVLNAMPTNRQWAQKIGAKPYRQMYNMYIPGGDASEADMMSKVDRGLIINRFWYIRFVDAKSGELTGMTRDGVLYFEDGKVKHAVNNLRFNEIPHAMTQRILELGPSTLCESTMRLPTMLVDDFNFVDKTSF